MRTAYKNILNYDMGSDSDLREDILLGGLSLEDFVHGMCHVFARVLSEHYGYGIGLCIYKGNLVHAFNYFEYEGDRYFFDARVCSKNLDVLLDEFADEIDDIHSSDSETEMYFLYDFSLASVILEKIGITEECYTISEDTKVAIQSYFEEV